MERMMVEAELRLRPELARLYRTDRCGRRKAIDPRPNQPRIYAILRGFTRPGVPRGNRFRPGPVPRWMVGSIGERSARKIDCE